MDHVRQIPQVGPAVGGPARERRRRSASSPPARRARGSVRWSPASRTATSRTSGRIVATLDVLSGGRAVCGIGARVVRGGAPRVRLAVPAGGGAARPGRRTRSSCCRCCGARARRRTGAACSTCPRRRATRGRCRSACRSSSAARASGGRCAWWREHADGCNLFGDPAKVRAKLAVLHAHCAAVGRDPAEIEVTHLSTALAGADGGRGRDADGRAAAGQGGPVEVRRQRRRGHGGRSRSSATRAGGRRRADGDRAAGRPRSGSRTRSLASPRWWRSSGEVALRWTSPAHGAGTRSTRRAPKVKGASRRASPADGIRGCRRGCVQPPVGCRQEPQARRRQVDVSSGR